MFTRYGIWHPKHESTFGPGARGPGCSRGPAANLFPLPAARPPRWAGGWQPALSSQPSPASLLAQAPGNRGEKVLGLPSCHEGGNCFSLQSTGIETPCTTSAGRFAVPIPRNAREEGPSIPLKFAPWLLLEPGFDSYFYCCRFLCFVLFKSKISAEGYDPVKVESKCGFF